MTPPEKTAPPRTGHQTTRVGNGLVALGSASVLAIYATGFMKTKAASDRMAESDAPRRAAAPVAIQASAPAMSLPPLDQVTPPARPAAEPAGGQSPRAAAPAPASSMPSATAVAPAAAPATVAAPTAAATNIVAKAGAAAAAPAPVTPTATSPVAADAAPAASTASQPAATPVAVAAAVAAAPAPAAAPGAVVYKDGVYTGWGTCRHGDIQAQVTIAGGRIASATISQCWTRYPCSWIAPLPPQVAQRQSAEVDYVSGATQSTNAFYYAVIEALSKAK